MTASMDERLQQVRTIVVAADAAAFCSPEGMILSVESAPGVDESVLGDLVAAAATMAADTTGLLQEMPQTIMMVSANKAAVARRLDDGMWVSLLLSDPASLGLALEALGELASPPTT